MTGTFEKIMREAHLEEDVIQRFLARCNKKEVKKGSVLVRVGDEQHYAYNTIAGCLRSFVTDSKGKDHILQFAPEGWVVADQESQVKGAPALFWIDAVENSTVLEIDHRDLEDIASRYPQVMYKMAQLYRNRIFALHKRIIELVSQTAEERYLNFTATYPQLANRLPQHMIASYLGITPEALSRVRKRLLFK
ncbi:MAG: Crp/Fnr family transcriptional regulator [Flavobacteriales bacterium]|nr:Crp/Fnr family transcriptional regulator [Flavobacteriales bacterium]